MSTVGVYPIYYCYLGLFGRNSSAGAGGLDISTRATVVCGAGLLCKKWYNENGYCTVGASYSYFVAGTVPVFSRYGGVFGRYGSDGGDSSGISARATVVCGAGLLYRRWYRKMQKAITDNQFSGSHFSVHFFQKQTEKWLSENRSSVLCTVKMCYTIL